MLKSLVSKGRDTAGREETGAGRGQAGREKGKR